MGAVEHVGLAPLVSGDNLALVLVVARAKDAHRVPLASTGWDVVLVLHLMRLVPAERVPRVVTADIVSAVLAQALVAASLAPPVVLGKDARAVVLLPLITRPVPVLAAQAALRVSTATNVVPQPLSTVPEPV